MFGLSPAIFSSPLGERGKKCVTGAGGWGGGKGKFPGRLNAEDLSELSRACWHFLLGLAVPRSSSLLLRPSEAESQVISLISQKSL